MGTRTNFVCSKCGKYEVAHRKGRSQCKACDGAYLREWKQNGKQRDYNVRMMEKRAQIKQLCIDYLGSTCQYKGGCQSPLKEDAPPCQFIYHFHHRDPGDKTFEISRRFRKGGKFAGKIETISDLRKSDPELIDELDKCILLCANCHHRLEYCDCKREVAQEGEILANFP